MAKALKVNKKPRTIPEEKTQINFNIRRENFDKIKFIAYTEGLNNSEIYNLAIENFIELYEKNNGTIKVKTKPKGLQEL